MIQARRWAAIAAALVLVNFALSFHNVWPTPWITARMELSVEAAAIVLAIVVLAKLGKFSPRVVTVFAIAMLFLAAARYMEVTAPALYGRGINLYWDAPHIPAVVAMMTEGIAPWLLAVIVLSGTVSVAVLFFAFRWALTTIAGATAERRILGGVSAGLVLAYLFGYYASVLPVLRWFSIPVTQTYMRQLEFVAEALAGGGAAASLPADDPLVAWQWTSDPDADVYVVFVESYGAVAYDAESVASELESHRDSFERTLLASGGATASAFVTSPTFGGVSWLAHASLMTGIDVTHSAAYNLLLTQERETLIDRFSTAGYRALALMPGLRGDWPEGSFYGFDRIYGERAIDYRGPAFGWWRVPDQFALARLDELELRDSNRGPLFTFFATISTHMPFRPTPPYQSDWRALTGPEPYSAELLVSDDSAVTDLVDLRPAYADALAYTYEYLGAYLSERSDREYLLVMLGDHQPPASVAGEGARWDVPVHAVASDGAMLSPFLEAGFAEGMSPPPMAVARTHELGGLLLEALGAARATD